MGGRLLFYSLLLSYRLESPEVQNNCEIGSTHHISRTEWLGRRNFISNLILQVKVMEVHHVSVQGSGASLNQAYCKLKIMKPVHCSYWGDTSPPTPVVCPVVFWGTSKLLLIYIKLFFCICQFLLILVESMFSAYCNCYQCRCHRRREQNNTKVLGISAWGNWILYIYIYIYGVFLV